MNDGIELSPFEPLPQFRRRHEVGNLAAGQIAPFVLAAENVADRDIAASGLVEVGDHVRSDKPGAAGDQQHRSCKTGLMNGSVPRRPPAKLCLRLTRRARSEE